MRKEVNTMEYNKPEVAVLGSAVNAIESGEKGQPKDVDSPYLQTISAYEADE
jgi:hypothetical protein